MNGAALVGKPTTRQPAPGEIAFCLNCGTVYMFDENRQLKPLNEDQEATIYTIMPRLAVRIRKTLTQRLMYEMKKSTGKS